MKNKQLLIFATAAFVFLLIFHFIFGPVDKILAVTRKVINTGADGSKASSQEISNYKKFSTLIKSLPVNQKTFYLTYSPKMDVILVNLYAPDYESGKTDFKSWATAEGYGNLPREFFKFNLTTKTISNVTVTASPLPIPSVAPTNSLSPVADTSVRRSNPATGYGSAATLQTGQDPTSYIYQKYNLTSVKPGPIKTAVLKLSVCKSSNCSATGRYSVYAISNTSWSESNVTFNNQPAGTHELLGSFSGAKLGQTLSVNLNTAVLQKYSGKNVTFVIKGTTVNDNAIFYSKENSSGKPSLTITQ